jgi:AraC-like DNA-binding protein
MSVDTLSEVLRAVRLQGAVFYDVHVTAPWVAAAPPSKVVAPHVLPGAGHVIEYHVITSGRCWGCIAGEQPLRLEAGDVIVFPQGDAHVLSSEGATGGTPDVSLFARPVGGQLPVLIEEGGGGEPCHIVCGFIGYDARPFNPLLATLPRMIHVRGGGGLIDPFVRMAVDESGQRRTGGEVVLARLSELMFVEVVRRYLGTLPPESPGWLGGLRDEFVGRALAVLHDRPTHDWTIDELASTVGLSRSALAERFTHFVGTPPMQYLAHWRMQLASHLLASGSASLAEIAHAVGYGSEAAFSRAFKRLVGTSPATWRAARQETAVSPMAASL